MFSVLTQPPILDPHRGMKFASRSHTSLKCRHKQPIPFQHHLYGLFLEFFKSSSVFLQPFVDHKQLDLFVKVIPVHHGYQSLYFITKYRGIGNETQAMFFIHFFFCERILLSPFHQCQQGEMMHFKFICMTGLQYSAFIKIFISNCFFVLEILSYLVFGGVFVYVLHRLYCFAM